MNDQATVRLVIMMLGAGMLAGLLVSAFTHSEAAASVASTAVGGLAALLASTRKGDT